MHIMCHSECTLHPVYASTMSSVTPYVPAGVPDGYYLKGPGLVAPCPQGEYKIGSGALAACTKCRQGVTTPGEASPSPDFCNGRCGFQEWDVDTSCELYICALHIQDGTTM